MTERRARIGDDFTVSPDDVIACTDGSSTTVGALVTLALQSPTAGAYAKDLAFAERTAQWIGVLLEQIEGIQEEEDVPPGHGWRADPTDSRAER